MGPGGDFGGVAGVLGGGRISGIIKQQRGRERADDDTSDNVGAPPSSSKGVGGTSGGAGQGGVDIGHYYCTDCGCYFTDEDGTVITTLKDGSGDYMLGIYANPNVLIRWL